MPKANRVITDASRPATVAIVGAGEGDELIISGDGPACWDDEDCNSYSTPADSGDDLITPQMVYLSTRKPYSAVDRGFHTSTNRPSSGHHLHGGSQYPASGCRDDEDCFEGSGDGRGDDDDEDDDQSNGSNGRLGSRNQVVGGGSSVSGKPAISYSWPGLKTPLPTPFYARPPVPTTPYEDKSIMFTSKPIPPSEDVISSLERQTIRPRATVPPRPSGPRVIIDVPKPSIPHREREKQLSSIVSPSPSRHYPATTISPVSTFNKSTSASPQRTALVISVIALIIIVIVILAPVIVFFSKRYRSASGAKSIDSRNKNYQFDPVTSGVPPLLLNPNAAGSVTHLNVVNPVNVSSGLPIDIKQSAGGLPGGPTLQQKNLKEWYV